MSFKQPWMNVAANFMGITEKSGTANHPEIMKWAKVVGGQVEKEYTADSIPWCGLFAAIVIASVGVVPVAQPLWARNWVKFGTKLSEPCFGCVMTFTRDGGGHVGFYVSEDSSYYHILGGNQSDSVNIVKIAKNRCIGYNWPPGMEKFRVPGRVNKAFTGKISSNEK